MHQPRTASTDTAPGVAPVDPFLADVVRSDLVEGHHAGRLVALDASGSIVLALGAIGEPILPRSSNKPIQAAGMVSAGLDLSGELLALAAASHMGETPDAEQADHARRAGRGRPDHIGGVRKILAAAGLTEADLRNTPDWPLYELGRARAIAAGEPKTAIAMNCSGKHAAMLATCVANGWDLPSYRDPEHPLQLHLRAELERLAGEPVAGVAVDGCGAPLFGISLIGLAKAFRACVLAQPGTPERRVADAMRAYPDYVAGTGRLDTRAMTALPGLLSKGGAEGVQAVALPDGRAVAFKVMDGANRAHGPILAAALAQLGVPADTPLLAELRDAPVLGGGEPVGQIQAAF